jgi:hypothetical protein
MTSSIISPWRSSSALENSEWSDGKLVIAGNRANIHLLQTAFYAVKL